MSLTFGAFLLTISGLTAICIALLYSRYRRRKQINPGVRAVLITGCDSGFGNLLARRLDTLGFKVFAGCLNSTGQAAKELEKDSSPKLEVLQLDVTKDRDIETARDHIAESLSGTVLWALVNNAGVAFHAEFEWFPANDFQRVMDVNFMGVVKVSRAFLPLIRASSGRVISIASMAGRTSLPGFAAYSASKAAVIAFSDSLRREMSHFGVKVIVLEPSIYKTDILSSSILEAQNEAFWEEADPGIKRDYGTSFFQSTQNARTGLTKRANPKIDEVVECYVEAVCSRYPKIRYVTPTVTGFLNDAMNCTFLAIQDLVLYHVLGVKAKPDMMNTSLQAPSGRVGRRRSHAS